jgi:hypothetical protein
MDKENRRGDYLVPSETINNLSVTIQNILISVKAEEKILFELLDNRLSSIEKRLENIENSIDFRPEIIITEQMTLDEAKKKVLGFIKKHGYTDISELHSAIKCDIQVLIKVVDELIKEGKVKG